MKLFSRKYFYLAILIGLLSSCGRSEIEEAPWNNNAPIPVVYSVISPNEPVQVYLSKTYNSRYPAEKIAYPEAVVYLCGSDSNWIELTRIKSDTIVFVDAQKRFTVEKGKTYSLKIVLNNKTIHAQTTVPATEATIKEATCVSTESTNNVNVNGEWQPYYVNTINVKFALPVDTEYGYFMTAFTNLIYGSESLTGTSFQSNYLYSPKDSTSFDLKLTTIDPFYKRYLSAEAINMIQSYQDNNAILTIIESFGGVLPHYSNIVNGVGLFGSSVTVSQRVVITKPAR